MANEVWNYFCEKYEDANFRVVYGHWPDFKSKEEVDEWIDSFEIINTIMFDELFKEEDSNA